MTDTSEYDVGYRKPPKSTRFKPGQSGNPAGRPKGQKNASTLLREALNETVQINENGRKREITKLEAMFKQLVNGAAKGDPKSMQRLIPLVMDLEAEENARSEKKVTHLSKEAQASAIAMLQQRLTTLVEDPDVDRP